MMNTIILAVCMIFTLATQEACTQETADTTHQTIKIVKIVKNGQVSIDTIISNGNANNKEMEMIVEMEMPDMDSLKKHLLFLSESNEMFEFQKDSLHEIILKSMNNLPLAHGAKKLEWIMENDCSRPAHKNSDDAFKSIAESDGWKVTEYSRNMKGKKEKIVIVREKLE